MSTGLGNLSQILERNIQLARNCDEKAKKIKELEEEKDKISSQAKLLQGKIEIAMSFLKESEEEVFSLKKKLIEQNIKEKITLLEIDNLKGSIADHQKLIELIQKVDLLRQEWSALREQLIAVQKDWENAEWLASFILVPLYKGSDFANYLYEKKWLDPQAPHELNLLAHLLLSSKTIVKATQLTPKDRFSPQQEQIFQQFDRIENQLASYQKEIKYLNPDFSCTSFERPNKKVSNI